jgi:hypothetical protein
MELAFKVIVPALPNALLGGPCVDIVLPFRTRKDSALAPFGIPKILISPAFPPPLSGSEPSVLLDIVAPSENTMFLPPKLISPPDASD